MVKLTDHRCNIYLSLHVSLNFRHLPGSGVGKKTTLSIKQIDPFRQEMGNTHKSPTQPLPSG